MTQMASGASPDWLLWLMLGAVVLPMWLLAGLCDYLAHARAQIERTSGVHESVLHLLQTAQIGVPMLAVLWLEVNASVLLLCVAGVLAHSVTAFLDLRYAQPRRHVGVFEQYVHAFLIVLPLTALGLVLVLHWPESFRGVHWALHAKSVPFDRGIVAGVLAASVAFGLAPGAWEFLRTWRHARRQVGDDRSG